MSTRRERCKEASRKHCALQLGLCVKCASIFRTPVNADQDSSNSNFQICRRRCTLRSTWASAIFAKLFVPVADLANGRAQSTVLTRAPPRRPARPRWDFIFNLSMRASKARPVVVCLHHAGAGGRRHFRLGVSSSVGHCCQHFGEGWGPNRIKGGLRHGKCQRDKQALQIFLGRLQLDDADVVVYKGSKTPRPCCRAVERACFGCARSVALVTLINMAGDACKCGVGSLVHRRKFDRSHSDGAVLCAGTGVSFSWARPKQQPNESWVSRRIW